MTADLKNNIVEKLEAVRNEMKSIQLNDVKDSVKKLGEKILEDPKYFFIPAVIASGVFLLLIACFAVIDSPIETFHKEVTTDLERRLQVFSKETEEAFKLMLETFKEEVMHGFGEQYGCCHKFKKVVITFLIALIFMGSFYRMLYGRF